MQKWLLVPDAHVPFHDKRAFSLMLRAAKRAGIKRAVILGDFADCYTVSAHSKDPSRAGQLKEEVDAVNSVFDVLEKQFDEVVFIEGNHEDRLRRYLQDRAPELFSTVNIGTLFRFRERGWKHIPYKDHFKLGKLFLTHDAGKAGASAHKDALNAFQGNVVIGHTHRLSYVVEGNAKGKPHVGVMLGWLGDFKKVDYLHRIRAARDWVHGFGVAYLEPNGCVHVTPVPIVNGKVVLEGKLIS